MRLVLVAMLGTPLVVLWPRRPHAERGAAERTSAEPARPGRVPFIARIVRRLRRRHADDAAERAVFAVLDVQMRLTTLTAILRRIDTDPDMFARQHHWRTTLWAYDSMLADACVLAGVAVHAAPAGPKADAERQRRELELYARGWSW